MSDDKMADPAGHAAQAGRQEGAKAPSGATRPTADAAGGDRAADASSTSQSQGTADSPAGGTPGPAQPLIPADSQDERAARVLQDRIDDSIGAAGAGPAA